MSLNNLEETVAEVEIDKILNELFPLNVKSERLLSEIKFKNKKYKVFSSVGLHPAFGFYPCVSLGHSKHQVCFLPDEWNTFWKYEEKIKTYYTNNNNNSRQIKVLQNGNTSCKFCMSKLKTPSSPSSPSTSSSSLWSFKRKEDECTINVFDNCKLTFYKHGPKKIKVVKLEKDGVCVVLNSGAFNYIRRIKYLIDYRLQRLHQLKFFEYYNNCLSYVVTNVGNQGDAVEIKNILLDQIKSSNYSIYYEGIEMLLEIIEFHFDSLLDDVKNFTAIKNVTS
jgi:hypothetical protein